MQTFLLASITLSTSVPGIRITSSAFMESSPTGFDQDSVLEQILDEIVGDEFGDRSSVDVSNDSEASAFLQVATHNDGVGVHDDAQEDKNPEQQPEPIDPTNPPTNSTTTTTSSLSSALLTFFKSFDIDRPALGDKYNH